MKLIDKALAQFAGPCCVIDQMCDGVAISCVLDQHVPMLTLVCDGGQSGVKRSAQKNGPAAGQVSNRAYLMDPQEG